MPRLKFANDGGPLLAIDGQLAPFWHGNVSGNDPDPIPSGSDYERACHAAHPAQIIPVGPGCGVVIGAQEGVSAAWWDNLSSAVLVLVGAVFGDDWSDDILRTQLEGSLSVGWQRLERMKVTSGRLLLFHAASEGAHVTVDPARPFALIEDAISATLPAGPYVVEAREVAIEDRALYNVVRWSPAESGPAA
jgi:hypothetical protein